MLKKVRNNKGITLVTLIVFIVVLLIIASISLNSITGDEGILDYTEDAKDSTELNDQREQGVISNIMNLK